MKVYSSLKEVEQRKELLRERIRNGNTTITRLSSDIFIPKTPDTRKERIAQWVNAGLIGFDIVMLAKKLDNKYAFFMKSMELFKKWRS